MAYGIEEVTRLTDAELVFRFERLVQADRALSAKLLVHLGEVDERKPFLQRGYSSTFDYCRTALGMSEAEAYLRMQAARVGRRFPLVVERLGSGAVHLSAIKLLSPHLTEDNHAQLLDRVRGRTKREIEVHVAELAPKPHVPARMRKLPEVRGSSVAAVGSACGPAPAQGTVHETSDAPQGMPLSNTCAVASANAPRIITQQAPTRTSPSEAASEATPNSHERGKAPSAEPAGSTLSRSFALQSPRARSAPAPLGLGRFKLELTLGQKAHDQLEQLQQLLRHQNPSGDLAVIVERAIGELLERALQKRFAQPRARARRRACRPATAAKAKAKARAKKPSRYIPRDALRAVHARDGGQCTFVAADGRRCSERSFLEVHHHHTTFARGGEATIENLRLACRAHNQFWAEQDYGAGLMQRKRGERRAGPTAPHEHTSVVARSGTSESSVIP